MKRKHLKLEWNSKDGDYIHHSSALGTGGITTDITSFRWYSYSLISSTVGNQSAGGICDTLIKAQIEAEKHLITKATAPLRAIGF